MTHPPWFALRRAEQMEVAAPVFVEEDDPDDPQKTVPLARYNTMLAILKNTLYVYGGSVLLLFRYLPPFRSKRLTPFNPSHPPSLTASSSPRNESTPWMTSTPFLWTNSTASSASRRLVLRTRRGSRVTRRTGAAAARKTKTREIGEVEKRLARVGRVRARGSSTSRRRKSRRRRRS